ncbi:SH3 domain-containing protein [Ferruginibacter sp.]
MQKLFFLFLVACSLTVQSQSVYYAAAKTGISLREAPNANAKVLEKIAYGEKLVTVADTSSSKPIVTEGFNGFWWKVKYNNKEGYVVSTYLLSMAPPKAGVKTLKDYFKQVSAPLGAPLVIKKSDAALNEMGESSITKQLFKNGMEWHDAQGYETGSEVYMLPDFTIEQCFLLLRILNQYPGLIGEKDAFPTKKTKTTSATGEKIMDVEKGDNFPGEIKRVKISSSDAVITDFEIFMLDNQAVIYYNAGV